MEKQMFCYQCQETYKGEGCTKAGVCGKNSNVASLMDLLLYVTKGICVVKESFPQTDMPEWNNDFVYASLFKTITNTNFSADDIRHQIAVAVEMKEALKAQAKERHVAVPNVDAVNWKGSVAEYGKKAKAVGILADKGTEQGNAMQLIIYGIKGIAAYMHHARELGYRNVAVDHFVNRVLAASVTSKLQMDELTDLILETGHVGLEAMKLLDKANTNTYGNQEMTRVNIGTRGNPAILVSGHDLKDLEELLEQTIDSGVDVYTHGEMLPANAYPFFKRYKHFVGNYGNAWWKQREELSAFKGPILFTTNCIVPPLENATYINRIYTTGPVALKNSHHIADRKDGKPKDFGKMIEHAKHCAPPREIGYGNVIVGFGHRQLSAFLEKIADAIEIGNISHIVVMAGCDGRAKSREYYSDFAQLLPHDVLILTAGCAKYRYNKLNLRSIEGIPKVIDAGQCNDTYSIFLFLQRLKEKLGYTDINSLPVTYNIAWYEQKSVTILLAMLYMGIRNINLGPTLPAFITPNMANMLRRMFGLGTISTPKEDIEKWVKVEEEVYV